MTLQDLKKVRREFLHRVIPSLLVLIFDTEGHPIIIRKALHAGIFLGISLK